MDRWIPLLQTFLHSPTPEADASLWLQQQQQQQQHSHSPAPRTSATEFLSLLASPAPNSLPYIQTLPPAVQSRILSFLAAEHLRFCPHRLRSLAACILLSNADPAGHSVFWLHRAARHLLDVIPSPLEEDQDDNEHYQEQSQEEEEFNALPDWLVEHASAVDPILSWLPLPPARILNPTPCPAAAFNDKPVPMQKSESVSESPLSDKPETSVPPPPPRPLDIQVRERASPLKEQLIASDTASEAIRLSGEIRHLCLGCGAGNELTLLGLIEPWETDDETASILLSRLPGDDGLCSGNWPARVLCSIALPKLLLLRSTASRALLSATIGFCKLHQKEAVDALLFPLVLREGGIGVHLCDVLARIVKECLHPAHVSAFCQRLLCWEWEDRNLICQPCHRELIANEVVWAEPLFTLFQHILNHDVHLTPDSVDCLVLVVEEMAGKFSKSLKFGNFFLCFVSKSARASGFHKLSLMRAAEKTDSFMTKSILAKLADRES